MATCDMCRWKVEKQDCPWNFMYNSTDYAEDCIDFRNNKFVETEFSGRTNGPET